LARPLHVPAALQFRDPAFEFFDAVGGGNRIVNVAGDVVDLIMAT
jgi:hypothetical protein